MTRKALFQYRLSVALILVVLLFTACGLKHTEVISTEPIPTEPPPTYPLLTMLAQIPQDSVNQADDFIYFNDYSAMEIAYNTTRPLNAKDYVSTLEDESYAAWWVVRMYNDWLFGEYLLALEIMPEKVGFSVLDVDQAVKYGTPPYQGLILKGRFNADAISAVYQTNLGMVLKDFNGITVWCWAEDCIKGWLPNPDSVMIENPFGGILGQRKPMTISDELLMASADLELVIAHQATAAGTLPKLADDPVYRAAVIAINQDAYIVQAIIANPIVTKRIMDKSFIDNRLPPGTGNAIQKALMENFQELPPFELLILADAVTNNEQIARLGIVYQDNESAEIAASILLDRLGSYHPLTLGYSLSQRLTEMNVNPRYYVRQEADRAILVLEFPTRKASGEEIVQMQHLASYHGSAILPGRVYKQFFDMLFVDDTGWLSIITLDELEAMRVGTLVGGEDTVGWSDIPNGVIDEADFGGIVILELDDGTKVQAIWDRKLGDYIIGARLEIAPTSDPNFWIVMRIVEMP